MNFLFFILIFIREEQSMKVIAQDKFHNHKKYFVNSESNVENKHKGNELCGNNMTDL